MSATANDINGGEGIVMLACLLTHVFLAADGLVLRQVVVQRPDQRQRVRLAQVSFDSRQTQGNATMNRAATASKVLDG